MKISILALLLALVIPLCTAAQIGGRYEYQFLNISSSARQVALGGEVLTLKNYINQALWNLVTINSNSDNKLAVSHIRYLTGVKINFISCSREISRRFGTLQAEIQYLEYVPLQWFLTLDNLQQRDVSVTNPSVQIIDLEKNITQEEVGVISNALRHRVISAELFLERTFNIRFGYNFRRLVELKL
ncbi:hypothetical protein [Polaribacter irgensii]|nr:hypothetical protein [Polaribacter irgensii]